MPFPDSFATARLVARRLTPAHYEDLRRLQTDPAYMAHLGGIRTEAQTGAYLAANLRHWGDYNFGLWLLSEKDGEQSIGVAVLRHLDVEGVDEVEVGYGFLPGFWGRGLATEVTTACLAFGFEALGLRSIVAVTSPAHRVSQRVLLELGFAHDRDVDLHGARCSLFRIERR